MQDLKESPKQSPDLLRRSVRALVPRGIRLALYHGRHAFASRGMERSKHLAEMLCHLGRREHKVTLPDDISLTVDIGDAGVGFPIWAEHTYEPEETALLKRTLRASDIFVDIGANLGYYTTFAAKQVGSGGRVIAFEPGPYNYGLLERNVRANGFTNVNLFNMALSNEAGTAVLNMSQENYGDNRIRSAGPDSAGPESVRVKTDTLDAVLKSLNIERVDCIKMDVQGFEGYVCDGMAKTLARGVATVFTEFWPSGIRATGKDPEDILRLFKGLGYSANVSVDGCLVAVPFDKVFNTIPKTGDAETEYLNLILCR